jgi:hypothetical protein
MEVSNETVPESEGSEEKWMNIKNIVLKAANNSLGKVNSIRKDGLLRIWDDKVKQLIEEKWMDENTEGIRSNNI